MNLRAQLAEALAIFDQCDAKAVPIGGLALAAHRVVRATTDIDFLLDASSYREVRNALVWCPRNNLKKCPMDFGPRQGARRSHSSAMATTSNAAFGSKDADIIPVIFGTPH